MRVEIGMKKFFLIVMMLLSAPAFAAEKSVAREWNEAMIQAIRWDYARPTVAARNLYHLSLALYDTWAIYTPGARANYINFRAPEGSTEQDRNIAMCFAAYRILHKRYANAARKEDIDKLLRNLMAAHRLDPENTEENAETATGIGNTVATMILDQAEADGAREEQDYATPPEDFGPLNPPLIVKQPGYRGLIDVNFWQPMALDQNVDQGGFVIPAKIVRPLTLHWGRLPPFALSPADRASDKPYVYLDPGPPAQFGGVGHADFVASHEQLIEFSSWLDPKDGVKIDISPRSFGNNSLGRNDGRGHSVNPFTGSEYAPQIVNRGDYARVLAEFWADGPNSETPPGHWNTMANYVADRPEFSRRWFGQGPELPPVEWDVKMYLTLNGALYDASIVAWGLKGYYQGSRPITAVRYLADLGQATDPKLPRYNPQGLHLKPGVIELITPELTEPGQRFAHLVGHEGEIAIRSWLGAPADPVNSYRGVGWILGTEFVPYQRPNFVTPPFPGYVSGHSTFSRAGAEVMTAITGSRYFPGGLAEFKAEKNKYLVFEDGPAESLSLQWATYFDAADQCSVSRIYGGIHAYIDDFTGRRLGSQVGRRALAKVQSLFGR
jgi:hypothetical protein